MRDVVNGQPGCSRQVSLGRDLEPRERPQEPIVDGMRNPLPRYSLVEVSEYEESRRGESRA